MKEYGARGLMEGTWIDGGWGSGHCKCGFNVFVEENFNLHTSTDYYCKWNDNNVDNLVTVTGVCILPFQWMVVSASFYKGCCIIWVLPCKQRPFDLPRKIEGPLLVG